MPRSSNSLFTQAAAQLTNRDRYLCRMLFEHRVLTTDQICHLAFDSPISARHRLAVLTQLHLVDRFRPRRPTGSAPMHYVLASLGAHIVREQPACDSEDPTPLEDLPTLRWRQDKALAIATSHRLPHLVGVNSVFTGLVRTARTYPDCALLVWWSERRCADAWAEFVRPDGYGLWTEAGRRVAFCLEFDTGTEHLAQLAGKLAGYADLAAVLDQPPWLLFVLPSRRREAEARRVLQAAALPVATAVDDPAGSAAGARWWPLGRAEQRCRLAALPGLLEGDEAGAADPAAGAAW